MKEHNIYDFKTSLTNGTGLALLYLRDKDFNLSEQYIRAILKACLRNLGYDQQIETDRAYYMYEIIKYSKNLEYFISKLEQTFRNNFIIDDWDAYHRFKILCLLAKYKDVLIKPLMYKIFVNNISNSFESILREDLVFIDGNKAAVFIIENVGSYMLRNNAYYENREFIKYIERKINPGFTKDLSKLAKSSSSIRKYLKISLENELNNVTYVKKLNISYDEIKKIIREWKKAGLFLKKLRISKNNLNKLARELLIEKDTSRLKNYLKIFWYREFPLEPEPIIKFAMNRNYELSTSAKKVLSNIKSESVRKLAIKKLNGKTKLYEISDNIALLKFNYRMDDKRIFIKLLNENYSFAVRHSIMSSILDVLGNNKCNNCIGIFKEIYNKLNCMSCREQLINILIKEKMLKGKILSESLFDANRDIRIKVRKYVQYSANNN